MDDYEVEVKKIQKENEKYLIAFENWLKEKGLSERTIHKRVSNASLYIDDYLNYYDVTRMEDGIWDVYMFLDDWFIRKCLWSSKASLKEMASSIKKFYQCMSEKGYVGSGDYQILVSTIKDNMDTFLESMGAYDNISCDMFDF